MKNKALLIVDPQNDFITGTLPVPEAEQTMNSLAHYIHDHGKEYSAIIITADSHPSNHCSFANNGGEWPEHCVSDSLGASIWPPIMEAISPYLSKVTILYKGTLPDREEYSVFKNIISSERFSEIINSYHIQCIDICGLAGDICVANTLKDGLEKYNEIDFRVLTKYSPSLDGGISLNNIVNAYGLSVL